MENTCLHNACRGNKPTADALKLLLGVGRNDLLLSRDINGKIQFHIALEYADTHGPLSLRIFVEAGDMELFVATDTHGRTPLSLIKRLKSDNYKSQEWKDFFQYVGEKISQEVIKSNNKKLEDKKKYDSKIIESLEARLEKLEKEKENEKIDNEKAIQILQTMNVEGKESLRSLQAEKESFAIVIASLKTEKESDAKLIEALQLENEKAKESLRSLQAEKEGDAELIQALQTKKEKIRIEKQSIVKELQERDKKIDSLESETSNQREDITNMQFKLDEAKKNMRAMKRKIEELETASKEESSQVKSKRSRFSFW